MSEKPVYIITFNSANYSMYVYKLLKDKKLSVYMIQTPCLLSSGCASSIEVPENQLDKVIDILKDKKTLIREIHKKYVNPEIRRYVYEKLEF